jgi:hypothetical protein
MKTANGLNAGVAGPCVKAHHFYTNAQEPYTMTEEEEGPDTTSENQSFQTFNKVAAILFVLGIHMLIFLKMLFLE